MNLYEKIKQSQEDFAAASAYVGEVQGTLTYLRDAIRRRIEADQNEILAKISTMEERLADESLSAPVRCLMVAELEKLKQTTLCPTSAEREAYEKEIGCLREAKADLEGLKFDFEEAIADLETEISEMKAKMSDDSTLTDLPSMIAAEQRTFENLCMEVHLAWTESETA